ncbi:CLUMA_CG016322, isoform A [Clunio marinus]|uniref:Succinate dehydrogenase assembly factor 4, mitochondrial n=1 Tax=Clunio marinus TaxID=568069 RepID=A0A1J1ITT7_9DIPT|nr:CLUMA_CG016322, isoform A [Clunio marinus]
MSMFARGALKTSLASSLSANKASLKNSHVRGLMTSILRLHDDHPNKKSDKPLSPRMEEFQKKLRAKTPIGKLDEIQGKHPYEEKEPLPAFPNNTNPKTGEIGGPRGPEPTRYGDWERKGRVTDF